MGSLSQGHKFHSWGFILSWPNHLPKAPHFLILSPKGLGFQYMNEGREYHKYSHKQKIWEKHRNYQVQVQYYTYRIKVIVIVKLRECGLESPAESLESQCHESVLHLVRQIKQRHKQKSISGRIN